MWTVLLAILFGIYLTMAIVTTIVVGLLCILGGRNEDMWKPFVFGPLWFIMIPLVFLGKVVL